MRKRKFELTTPEIRELRTREQQTRDVHELKRLQAVRLYGTGQAVPTIQEIVGVSEASIRQWAQRYCAAGLSALRSKWQGKNAQKLNDEQRTDLRERLNQGGPAYWQIRDAPYWTVAALQVAIQQWYQVTYQSLRSYVRLFHESGLSYQRPEKVYRSRPAERDISEFEATLEKKR
ncbi:MAG: hypothetical protein SCABRO_01246 [Candidatus Scalindua brodae]|uniref:Winged helix-turn helix domain-containing protein n=1 Tax=Candidatus Scalindua brodae TaxID=237368 RepID=A0A0B0EPE7_9BACT|nr:MAG: hypothetical protein SCABRO_01246 [Candidatus Scalindua brodae]